MKKIKYTPYNPNFKKINFPDESWSYIAPTWGEMAEVYLDLAVRILEEEKNFDILVTLAKGGWTWARTMVDVLNIPHIASLELTSYDPSQPGKRLKTPSLNIPLSIPLKGKRTLLFDDVNDTGESLKWSVNYLNCFSPSSLTTATLFHKPHSIFKPDFYSIETSAWIIFPHERREAVVGLAKKWQKKGMSAEIIKKRLIKIGLVTKEVNLFLGLEGI